MAEQPTAPGMVLRVLGCSGSIAAGCKTTSFLLDDDVLIDAGTGVSDLPLDALARIDHVLLSHSHLDHVLAVPLLADSVLRLRMQQGRAPIQVHALPETLGALRQHIGSHAKSKFGFDDLHDIAAHRNLSAIRQTT
jgi:glyoxylase-like metal-dependent hydrolase (beta-lactamase superfamily II)